MNLFNIKNEYQNLIAQIEENGGDINEEQAKALELNESNLTEKSESYVAVIKRVEWDIYAINKEIDRLQDLKASSQKISDRLKLNLKEAMQVFKVDEIKTPISKISFRKSTRLEINDEELIADEYKTTTIKTVTTIDKNAIKAAFKRGDKVLGAVLIENQNIQIK
jgi:hypothetical protein